MAALPLPPPLPHRCRRGGGVAAAVDFLKFIAAAADLFSEDIEKVHEFGRISVLTSKTSSD